ncbi:MAG: hypothetical protein EXS25_09350 [Pedosphaera sp.]|nr:hypothetical protein [Pedosphaera sp.]
MIEVRHSGDNTLHLGVHELIHGSGAEAAYRIQRAPKVVVHIDSIGGCSRVANELIGRLLAHDNYEAYVLGRASSAAALIARACLQVFIVSTGTVMLHRVTTAVLGHCEDFEKAITTLSELDRIQSLVLGLRVPTHEILRLDAPGIIPTMPGSVTSRLSR